MRTILTLSALLLLMPVTLMAGSGYDRCLKEEAALKAKEKDACSGLSYVLNPSGCFAARKALKEYTSGKCRKIGVAERVDSTAPAAVPAKTAEYGAPQKGGDTGQPVDEIARLNEEIGRLKAEIERLRQRCGE